MQTQTQYQHQHQHAPAVAGDYRADGGGTDYAEDPLLYQCLSPTGAQSILEALYMSPNSSPEFRRLFLALSPPSFLAQLLPSSSGAEIVSLLLSLCTEGQCILLLQNLRPVAREITSSSVGVEGFSRVLGAVSTQKQLSALMTSLTPHLPSMALSEPSCHFLVTLLESCPEQHTAVLDRVLLAESGLLQKAVRCRPGQAVLCALLRARATTSPRGGAGTGVARRLASLSLPLSNHKVGSVVLRTAITHSSELLRVAFYRALEGHFLRLSLSPVSSALVCHCLTTAPPLWQQVQ